VDAAEIEAALSLWLSSVNHEESQIVKGMSPSETVEGDDKWLRSGGTTSKRGVWVVGEQTSSLDRDLSWWIPEDLPCLIRVRQANKLGPLSPFRHSVVGFSQHGEKYCEIPLLNSKFDTVANGFEDDDNEYSEAGSDCDDLTDGDSDAEHLEIDQLVDNYNNPADDYNNPADDCNNPADDCNNPADDCNNPADDYNDPADDCNNPADDYNNPAGYPSSDSGSNLSSDVEVSEASDRDNKSVEAKTENPTLLCTETYQSTKSLYAMDLY
jgi:hypothetical protein